MMCHCFMGIFFRFGVARLWVVTNSKISFVCFVLLRRAISGELNFSQYFLTKS